MEITLLDAYNFYCAREFGDEPLVEIPEDGILDVAWTKDLEGDDQHTYEVKFDSINMKWLSYVDEKLVIEEPTDEKEAIWRFIKEDFDSMMRPCVNKAWEIDQSR